MSDRDKKKWTEDDSRKILANPVYTGMGSFPQIVDEETWVKTATKQIAATGAKTFLRRMLKELRESLEGDQPPYGFSKRDPETPE